MALDTIGQETPIASDRFLSLNEVLAMIGGVGSSTLYRWIGEGAFPAQRQLGPKRVAWLESEVLVWMRSRPVPVKR